VKKFLGVIVALVAIAAFVSFLNFLGSVVLSVILPPQVYLNACTWNSELLGAKYVYDFSSDGSYESHIEEHGNSFARSHGSYTVNGRHVKIDGNNEYELGRVLERSPKSEWSEPYKPFSFWTVAMGAVVIFVPIGLLIKRAFRTTRA
jgi:hypothetical protein